MQTSRHRRSAAGRTGGHEAPVRILDVELGGPLPAIETATSPHGRRYQRAQVLARLHGWPLGVVNVELDPDHGTLDPASYRRQLWQGLAPAILEHLERDGLAPARGLRAAGLPAGTCVRDLLPAEPPLASVIVSTRDRPHYIVGCLDPLLAQAYPRYEIVVVDNAPSTSATADLLWSRYGHLRQVRYVREPRPGLSHARNRGVREAGGEILAFTDDDVRVDRRWLAALVSGFDAVPGVACVTGPILSAELDDEAHLSVERWMGGGRTCRRRVYNLDRHRDPSPLYPYSLGQFGAGASMAFSASALRRLGGFDPALGAGSRTGGGEDLDIFFRVLAAGMTLVHEPGAVVRHLPRTDYDGLRQQVYRNGVGFTAVLTKCLLDRPARVAELATRVPVGVLYLLRSRAPDTEQPAYPRDLFRQELTGMALGPLTYLRSRHELRRAGRRPEVGWA